jgi:hypothetical protein
MRGAQHANCRAPRAGSLFARHLRAALWALLPITGYTCHVRLSMPATGTDAVATGTGSSWTAHPAWPTSTTATTTLSTTSTHSPHLLPSPTPTGAPIGARRRAAALLLTAAGMSRLPSRLPARHERGRYQLIQRGATTVRAGNAGPSPHQHLKRRLTTSTAILVDRHRTTAPQSPGNRMTTSGGRTSVLTRVACRATPINLRSTSSGSSGSM